MVLPFCQTQIGAFKAARANGSAVPAATDLVGVLSEEREQESLLPELRDSIRLPPGRDNRIYKRKKKNTQTRAQIWELSEIRFCCARTN